MECALYVVATPIGNLRDISLRALDILGAVETIAAEDTRNTIRLLSHHGISGKKLLALHQHNELKAAEKISSLLAKGSAVAMVTDAGTPAVSDPGALLVQTIRNNGHRVIPVPGANAAMAALSASGLTFPHFLFYGFLPSKSSARQRELQTLENLPYCLIFYEAPHRIVECVADMQKVFGDDREIVFARELTKMFENFHACSLGEATAWLDEDPNNRRGEFVLLVTGLTRQPELGRDTERILSLLLENLPLKKAAQITAQITGDSRNKIYDRALQLGGKK